MSGFSIKRLGCLMAWELRYGQKGLLYAGIPIFLLTMAYSIAACMEQYAHTFWDEKVTLTNITLLMLVSWRLTKINKTPRMLMPEQNYWTLPATAAEKFASTFIIRSIVPMAYFAIVFVLTDVVMKMALAATGHESRLLTLHHLEVMREAKISIRMAGTLTLLPTAFMLAGCIEVYRWGKIFIMGLLGTIVISNGLYDGHTWPIRIMEVMGHNPFISTVLLLGCSYLLYTKRDMQNTTRSHGNMTEWATDLKSWLCRAAETLCDKSKLRELRMPRTPMCIWWVLQSQWRNMLGLVAMMTACTMMTKAMALAEGYHATQALHLVLQVIIAILMTANVSNIFCGMAGKSWCSAMLTLPASSLQKCAALILRATVIVPLLLYLGIMLGEMLDPVVFSITPHPAEIEKPLPLSEWEGKWTGISVPWAIWLLTLTAATGAMMAKAPRFATTAVCMTILLMTVMVNEEFHTTLGGYDLMVKWDGGAMASTLTAMGLTALNVMVIIRKFKSLQMSDNLKSAV